MTIHRIISFFFNDVCLLFFLLIISENNSIESTKQWWSHMIIISFPKKKEKQKMFQEKTPFFVSYKHSWTKCLKVSRKYNYKFKIIYDFNAKNNQKFVTHIQKNDNLIRISFEKKC